MNDEHYASRLPASTRRSPRFLPFLLGCVSGAAPFFSSVFPCSRSGPGAHLRESNHNKPSCLLPLLLVSMLVFSALNIFSGCATLPSEIPAPSPGERTLGAVIDDIHASTLVLQDAVTAFRSTDDWRIRVRNLAIISGEAVKLHGYLDELADILGIERRAIQWGAHARN